MDWGGLELGGRGKPGRSSDIIRVCYIRPVSPRDFECHVLKTDHIISVFFTHITKGSLLDGFGVPQWSEVVRIDE